MGMPQYTNLTAQDNSQVLSPAIDSFLKARSDREDYDLRKRQEQRLQDDAIARRKLAADENARAAALEVRNQEDYTLKKPSVQAQAAGIVAKNVDDYLGNEYDKMKGMPIDGQQPYYENVVRPTLLTQFGIPSDKHPKFGSDLTRAGLTAQDRQRERETQDARTAAATAAATTAQNAKDLQTQKDQAEAERLKAKNEAAIAAAKAKGVKPPAAPKLKPAPVAVVKDAIVNDQNLRNAKDIATRVGDPNYNLGGLANNLAEDFLPDWAGKRVSFGWNRFWDGEKEAVQISQDRADLQSIREQIQKELTGAASNKPQEARISKFTFNMNDPKPIIQSKVAAFLRYQNEKATANRQFYSPDQGYYQLPKFIDKGSGKQPTAFTKRAEKVLNEAPKVPAKDTASFPDMTTATPEQVDAFLKLHGTK